jgi:outer membrane lipoprotein-sorting protein
VGAVLRAAEHPGPVSGTVNAHVDLGLPSFPVQGAAGPTGIAGLLAELTGDHRVRLWASRDGYRADELLPTSERAIYVSAQGGWLWSSDAFTAYRLFGAQDVARLGRAAAAQDADRARLMHLADPLTLASAALTAASPTTSVSIGPPVRVAGRSSYVLVLTPKDATTLVGRVEIAVDAGTHVPLSVGVFAKGAASPAISAAFSSVSFAPIAASVYRFSPPAGATVQTFRHRSVGESAEAPSGAADPSFTGSDGGVRVFGAGWSTIVAIRVPASALAATGSAGPARGVDLARFLPYSGPLFSVRLVATGDHAWLLAGAVPQSALAGVGSHLS